MATVFFSYSHVDENLRDQLEVHLAMLKNQGLIEAWHDRRIKVGDEFGNSISAELERADVILLLVSPEFLASKYCYEIEMTRAMERQDAGQARVIPVILRHCDWHAAPFGKLLAAPKDGKPVKSWSDIDEAFLDVVKMIRTALPSPLPAKVDTESKRPVASPPLGPLGPRSSNLRLKKDFTEADRDQFLHDAFEFMARFFENSLRELEVRNSDIKAMFRRVDANRFTSVIYRDGKAIARCKIMLGGMFGAGISFAYNDQTDDGSINESMSVESTDQGMHMKPLVMPSFRQVDV